MAARRSTAMRRNHRVVMVIGLSLLRNRQLHVKVITGIIGLVALASLGRENQARILTRLAAWNQQQTLRYQRKATTRPA
jgi:hypothetical protein